MGDLVITDAYIEYTKGNRYYWMRVEIKNIGPNPVKFCRYQAIWRTIDYPTGLWWGSVAPGLIVNPGEVCKVGSSGKSEMPNGEYSFILKVDPDDLRTETNERNNSYRFTVKVPEDVRVL
jgi:hypothetical protein